MIPEDPVPRGPIDVAALIAAARDAAKCAHAPYSGFGVGAAVLLSDGRIIPGCNFENASYGLTLCAETVALAAVNMAGGLTMVRAIAIAGGMIVAGKIAGADVVHPCGRCRQVISEAAQWSGTDIQIYCADAENATYETHSISSLLPHAFGPKNLGMV